MDFVVNPVTMSCRTSASFIKKQPENGDGKGTSEEGDPITDMVGSKPLFKIGEDVYYQEDTGQNVLGTVGMIQGKKVKIVFGDETEKWAPLSRVKKMMFSFDDEDDDTANQKLRVATPSLQSPTASSGDVMQSFVNIGGPKKKGKLDVNGQVAPRENYQVTCGSCGTQKMITPKKAMEFSPYTTHQFTCRKCINKSKTTKNNGVPMIAAHYLAATRGKPRSVDPNGMLTSSKSQIMESGLATSVFRPESDICLHCRSQIQERVSLHCTMCERPCHPSCLALTPPPLPGDIFWSIICQSCGTQKPGDSPENDSQKVYSSRRSISTWSDVACLLLSCLGCKNPNEKFFDIDEQIIPFLEENIARLHLPRQYKNTDAENRRKCLLLALNNASLRFLKDDKRKSSLYAIKDQACRNFTQVLLKPPLSGGRGTGVTAAGFPISVRASNPEATSVAMTNIAQTIATQAAANKANGVPFPKTSPSQGLSKSVSLKGCAVGGMGNKKTLPMESVPVAKKTGTEIASRAKQDIWPQQRNKIKFLPELPKTSPNNILGSPIVEILPSIPPISSSVTGIRLQPPPTQSPQSKHTPLSPSAGGAARVTGVVISSSSSGGTTDNSVNRISNVGSYPVRKNGSSVMSRSVKVDVQEKKSDRDVQSSKPSADSVEAEICRKSEDFIRESPGFNNQAYRLPVKRKLSTTKATVVENSSSRFEPQDTVMVPTAKKVKMNLPSSTDITSQRIPSPTRPSGVDSRRSSDSSKPQKALSPIQKLTDLIRNGNGGLTIARITESGVEQVNINPLEFDKTMDETGKEGSSSPLVPNALLSSSLKNSNGATESSTSVIAKDVETTPEKKDGELTKEKGANVTTSPRAFKLAAISSSGSVKTSPVLEQRRTRPVRLKRNVAANAQAEKQSKEASESKSTKKLSGKGLSVPSTLTGKGLRGRPKKPFKLPLPRPYPPPGLGIGRNGIVENSDPTVFTDHTVNLSEFLRINCSIKDLVEHDHTFTVKCLPPAPEGEKAKDELERIAKVHLLEELSPRPPSYWSKSSDTKRRNQKSRKDLKDLDSYYISGRSIGPSGIKYQVVWRDSCYYESSSDEDEELPANYRDEDYLFFEDYDSLEYLFDEMPVTKVESLSGEVECDKSRTDKGRSDNVRVVDLEGSNDGAEKHTEVNSSAVVAALKHFSVKSEPDDSADAKRIDRRCADKVKNGSIGLEETHRSTEPVFIDLTDSP